MIAIFTSFPEDFDRARSNPKKEFKVIRKVNDIRGIRFTSLLEFQGWSVNQRDRIEAYEALKIRQPELFNGI